MVGSCDLADPPSGVSTRNTEDGGGFRQVRWRGLEGWVRTSAVSTTPAPAPKFASDKFIHIVVAGSEAGKFSAAFHGWVTGAAGSAVVSRKIDC